MKKLFSPSYADLEVRQKYRWSLLSFYEKVMLSSVLLCRASRFALIRINSKIWKNNNNKKNKWNKKWNLPSSGMYVLLHLNLKPYTTGKSLLLFFVSSKYIYIYFTVQNLRLENNVFVHRERYGKIFCDWVWFRSNTAVTTSKTNR